MENLHSSCPIARLTHERISQRRDLKTNFITLTKTDDSRPRVLFFLYVYYMHIYIYIVFYLCVVVLFLCVLFLYVFLCVFIRLFLTCLMCFDCFIFYCF